MKGQEEKVQDSFTKCIIVFLYNNQTPYKCRSIGDMNILLHSLKQG